MKFVVDANILFSLCKESSAASGIFSKHDIKLVAPDFALIELYKYKKEIIEKSGGRDFEKIIENLKNKVVFINKTEYKDFIERASSLISDENDVSYVAVALRFFFPIWSNDSHMKEQDKVVVFTTKDLIDAIDKPIIK
jgi:predicted nucleic acid-binding protein